ncbi:hypothetical protein IAU59_003654 [Kwoniella sp. CBS 9459]
MSGTVRLHASSSSEPRKSLSPTSPTYSQSSFGSRRHLPNGNGPISSRQGSEGRSDSHVSPVSSRHMVDGSDHDDPDELGHEHDSEHGYKSKNGTRRRSSSNKGDNDKITVRRREANRLAAQRFRSRKKGYQDQLEERVRSLEGERDVLIRQLDGNLPQPSQPSNHPDSSLEARSSNLRQTGADGMIANGQGVDPSSRSATGSGSGAGSGSGPFSVASRTSGSMTQSISPDQRASSAPYDVDIRVAALESANKRLQETVRNLQDDNGELRDELRRWRAWGRDVRNGDSPRSGLLDGDQYGTHQPKLPRICPSASVYANPVRGDQTGLGPPPLMVEAKDRTLVQLPSLRLPPIRTALSPDGTPLLSSPPFSTSLRSLGGPGSLGSTSSHLNQPRS